MTFNIANIGKIWEMKEKIRKIWSMTKRKKSSEIFAAKNGKFSPKNVIQKSWVRRKNFPSPPNSAPARSPPLAPRAFDSICRMNFRARVGLHQCQCGPGSGFGPTGYVVSASDLPTVDSENRKSKYADDTYLIIDSFKGHTVRCYMSFKE